jgi:Tfp pilus assembly protein PilF
MLVCVVAVPLAGWNTVATTEQATDRSVVEKAYQANNVGVGWLEQFNYERATERFQEALRLNPALGNARFNHALPYI